MRKRKASRIEVQHSSDKKLDGKWFEIDRGFNHEWIESRYNTISVGYFGRPVRVYTPL